jgi:hypothetical protein
MRKKLFLLGLFAGLFVSSAYTQNTTENKRYLATQKKYTFAIQPFQAFNGAWRSDFEMRLGDGPGWLQYGLSLYSADENSEILRELRESASKLRGAGLEVNYKRFLDSRRSLYFAGGLSYTHFKIDYWGYSWVNYVEDGLQYHTQSSGYYTQQIDRLGINAFFGYQIPARGAFLFDAYTGLAQRYSFSDKNKPSFNDTMFSYGYTGPVFLLGIRVGFGVR